MTSGFNWIDYILLAIFFISILGGLSRGGVREIISLLSWIAGFIVAGLFAKPLAAFFTSSQGVQSILSSASSSTFGVATSNQISLLAIGVSFCLLFFGTMIVGSMIGYFANTAVEGGGVSIGNRLIGGMFGLLRGYLMVVLVVFLVQLTPVSQQSFWTQSALVSSFQPAVQWFGNLVQPGLQSLKATVQDITAGAQSVFQH